jgi:hypothetical protein
MCLYNVASCIFQVNCGVGGFIIPAKIYLITQNNSFDENWEAKKNLGKLLRILQNVIEKSFINWRILPLVKINTRISDTTLYILNSHYVYLFCKCFVW